MNKEKKIVGIGYNGMPRGCPDDSLPWGKTSDNELENKYMYVCIGPTDPTLGFKLDAAPAYQARPYRRASHET